jgi:cytochrome c553
MKKLFAAIVTIQALACGAAFAGDVKKGEELVKAKACLSCHGEGMNKPTDATIPKLAGQYEDYLFFALKSYKVEGNPVVGRNNASMVGFAKQLSTKDMKDIAAYVAQLPGELKVAPEPKIRLGQP